MLDPALATSDGERAAYREEIERWRRERLDRLRSPDGWLSVVGLFWLEPGENSVGTDPSNRIVVPGGRATDRLGTIALSEDRALFTAAPGSDVRHAGAPVETVELRSDAGGPPTVLTRGRVSFYLIRRSGRLAVRVKDTGSAARRGFRGIESFPIEPGWRVEARFEPYDPPRELPIANVLGGVDGERCPGAIVFERAGATHSLDAIVETAEPDLFVIFGDETNGVETYGAGRFLYAPRAAGGRTVLDFNKAYNPPCVFTPYATCPLPPSQNRLPLRVEAGEKKYAGS